MGAMTNDKLYFRLADGTNTKVVNEFFVSMAQAHNLSGTTIVLDNHPAHVHNRALQELMQGLGAELLFLPQSSSVLNPIETLWAIMKRRFR